MTTNQLQLFDPLPEYPNREKRKVTPLHDQILAALATATPGQLQQMIAMATPSYFGYSPGPWTWTSARGGDVRLSVPASTDRYSQAKHWRLDAVAAVGRYTGEGSEFSGVHNPKEDWRFEFIVEVKTEVPSLSKLLDQLTGYKKAYGTPQRLLLICPTLEGYERATLQSQGFAVLTNIEILTKGQNLDLCSNCAVAGCPAHGQNIPIRQCLSYKQISTEELLNQIGPDVPF